MARRKEWPGLRKGARVPALVLAFALALALVSASILAPGCRPHPAPPSGSTDLRALEWALAETTPDPAGAADWLGGRAACELAFSNQGKAAVSLEGQTVLLAGDEGVVAGPVALPASVPAGGLGSVKIEYSVGADWPASFTLNAVVSDVIVASLTLAPETLGLRFVWPTPGLTDIPADDYFLVKFDRAIDVGSLLDKLDLRQDSGIAPPPSEGQAGAAPSGPDTVVSVEVMPDRNGDPTTYEARPVETLAPLARYVLTVRGGLLSSDHKAATERPVAVAFSTGAPSGLASPSFSPAWSPDGSKVAWTGPAVGAFSASHGGRVPVDLWVGTVVDMSARRVATGVSALVPAFTPDGRYLYYAVPAASGGGESVVRLELATGAIATILRPDDLQGGSPLRLAISPDGAYLAVESCLGGVDAHSDIIQTVYVYDLGAGRLTALPGDGYTSVLVGWLAARGGSSGAGAASGGSSGVGAAGGGSSGVGAPVPAGGPRLLYATTYQNYDNSHHFRYNLQVYDPAGATRRTILGEGQLDNVGGYSVALAAPVAAYWTWEAQSLGRWIVHRPRSVTLLAGLDQATAAAPTLLAGAPATAGPFSAPDVPTPAGPPYSDPYSPGPDSYRQAAISPDGSLVAAAKAVDGSWDIVVARADGTGGETVASGRAAQFAPAWSPSGDRLAYFEVAPPVAGDPLSLLVWRVVVADPTSGHGMAFNIES